MKKNISRTAALAVSGLLAALSALNCAIAYAQVPNNSLATDVTLSTSSTVMQGEPIVLHYRVTNTGNKELEMGISLDETRFLTQSLEDAQGKVTQGHRPLDPNTTTDQSGLLNGGEIDGRSSTDGSIVVNQWFPSLPPGTYTLSVHTVFGYSDADQIAQTVPHTKVADFRQEREDFQFPLTVTAPVPSRLQALAERLEQEIIQSPPPASPERKLLLGELFSIPEAQALPSWKKLASSPSLASWALYDVLDNLMHVKTAATADILIDMIADYSQKPEIDPYIQSAMVNTMAVTYRDGDLPLKQHIRLLYASRGMPLAKIVGVPGRVSGGN